MVSVPPNVMVKIFRFGPYRSPNSALEPYPAGTATAAVLVNDDGSPLGRLGVAWLSVADSGKFCRRRGAEIAVGRLLKRPIFLPSGSAIACAAEKRGWRFPGGSRRPDVSKLAFQAMFTLVVLNKPPRSFRGMPFGPIVAGRVSEVWIARTETTDGLRPESLLDLRTRRGRINGAEIYE